MSYSLFTARTFFWTQYFSADWVQGRRFSFMACRTISRAIQFKRIPQEISILPSLHRLFYVTLCFMATWNNLPERNSAKAVTTLRSQNPRKRTCGWLWHYGGRKHRKAISITCNLRAQGHYFCHKPCCTICTREILLVNWSTISLHTYQGWWSWSFAQRHRYLPIVLYIIHRNFPTVRLPPHAWQMGIEKYLYTRGIRNTPPIRDVARDERDCEEWWPPWFGVFCTRFSSLLLNFSWIRIS